jgi:hypothetical protein
MDFFIASSDEVSIFGFAQADRAMTPRKMKTSSLLFIGSPILPETKQGSLLPEADEEILCRVSRLGLHRTNQPRK